MKLRHLTTVRVKPHPERVDLVESLSFIKMKRSTVEDRVKIIKFYYNTGDLLYHLGPY